VAEGGLPDDAITAEQKKKEKECSFKLELAG